jgi:hypothetical protein
MKEIPNKQFTETDSTASLLRTCLNNPGKTGLDLPAIRARNRVADAIEKVAAGDIIKLEDADHGTAQQAIRDVRWASCDKHLVQFAEQFGL